MRQHMSTDDCIHLFSSNCDARGSSFAALLRLNLLESAGLCDFPTIFVIAKRLSLNYFVFNRAHSKCTIDVQKNRVND